jgi:hypothetical protein
MATPSTIEDDVAPATCTVTGGYWAPHATPQQYFEMLRMSAGIPTC